ncbi:unnamed protein product [Gongylonema pulchrum]|uniref:D-lactate dehydrogenase (cytochrome) n=1 Tax=Gongylonema pulchrum TaxID=637853 RepID=A0A183DQU2_9BILA|nr:unnamed protein product [Gongylonema pulchrum]
MPDVVVMPRSVEEVAGVVRMCNDGGIPVVPFGAGTGLEGGVNAVMGGVSMDMMSMDKVVEVNSSDFDCIVEPGVTHEALNKRLHDTGLWFSVDPGADASICGMAATGASGTNAVRYGTMLHNILNLQVNPGYLLEHFSCGGPGGAYSMLKHDRDFRFILFIHMIFARKSAAGYNLTKLFIGSEGTLGVITQATVRLQARPAVCSVAICPFPTVSKAIEAVVATIQCSVPIAKIEFLDATTVAACNKYSKLTLAESPTLFLEFHGNSEAEVASQASLVGRILLVAFVLQFTSFAVVLFEQLHCSA